MENANEQRAERRLRYRWPVRFARSSEEKPLQGQMVDVSSKGMALLCHANKNCPHVGQPLTANFAVPHFAVSNSFDAVFFNRHGRVCRVDDLSSRVRRVAVQFAEPLFFRPGEQSISESEAQRRLEAKALSIIEAEEKARAYSEVLARAEEKTRFYAQARAQAEEKLKAEIESRYRAEAQSRLETEEKIRAYAEAHARAEEKAKSESRARAEAEARAKAEAKLRAKAEKRVQAETEKRAKTEAEAQEKIKSYVDKMAVVKAEAAQEIAKARAEAADAVAEIMAELGGKTETCSGARGGVKRKSHIKDIGGQSAKDSLLEKVDKFITDRNKIF